MQNPRYNIYWRYHFTRMIGGQMSQVMPATYEPTNRNGIPGGPDSIAMNLDSDRSVLIYVPWTSIAWVEQILEPK